MALHIPRNTAYFQEHLILADSHSITYRDGELAWDGEDSDAEKSVKTIKDEEIIFIAHQSQGIKTGYLIFCLKERPEDPARAYQLSTFLCPSLPQEVLDKHLLKDVPEALKESPVHQLHVIISTRSGIGLAESFYDAVLRPLLTIFGLNYRVPLTSSAPSGEVSKDPQVYDLLLTSSSESIKEFAQNLWKPNPGNSSKENGATTRPTIILLSGDGGVVDLLNGSHRTGGSVFQPVVALLPLGTGNALFHSLHKAHYKAKGGTSPSPLVLGLRTVFKGAAVPLPTFQALFSPGSRLISYSAPAKSGANGNSSSMEERSDKVDHLFGAIVASYGFHSQLVWESDTPEYRKHGEKRFGMVAQELLKTSHAYHTSVEVRGPGNPDLVALERSHFNYILATMVSNLEKNFTISPANKPLDGQLRLVYFGDVGGEKTMEIMVQAYNNGAHVGMEWEGEDGKKERVGYDEVEEVRINVLEADSRWRKACIDGTIVEIPEGGWMSVRKVPESTYQVLVDRSVL